MASNGIYELEKLLGPDFGSARAVVWIWYYLNKLGVFGIGECGPGVEELLVKYIENNEFMRMKIVQKYGSSVLPDSHFEWIGDDFRQNDYVFNSMRKYSDNWKVDLPPSLIGRQRTLALVDCCNVSLPEKISVVDGARRAWGARLRKDHIFDWFLGRDEVERAELFWQWLAVNNPFLVVNKIPFSTHQGIVSFFYSSLIQDVEQELIILKFKKVWSQRRYRQGMKGKRQCNLVLNEKTIKILDDLSGRHGLSRAEIIEILIQDESVQGVYISARIERYKSLVQGD